MNSVIEAILKINPKAQVSVSSNDINTIVWENGTTPIPFADIQAKIVEVEAEYRAKQYQRDRAAAYPSLAAQLDMQYWDSVNGTTVWSDTIAAIKQEYPKP